MMIRSLCQEVFNGRHSTEIFKEYGKWLMWITDIFLPICESEHGDLLFLPFEGTILDQPYMSMNVVKYIQSQYRKFLNDQMTKLKYKK